MLFPRFSLLLILAALLASCDSQTVRASRIGEVFVGPATLNLRQEISLRSPTVATVNHGEELDVVEAHRRFLRVRTIRGIEGWTDTRMVLSTQQMDDLRSLAVAVAKMTSQGTAVALEPLNMHAEPNRLSANFYQIPEKAKLEVLDRKVVPRVQSAPPPISFPKPPPLRKPSKRKPTAVQIPAPAPPAPPPGWIGMSEDPKAVPVAAKDREDSASAKLRAKDAPPVDDWSLARAPGGQAGWVISRMFNMAIPDEVAQYAEGHRITSYFSLGQIQDDENGLKNHWLWTTMAGVRADCDFDSFRIFIWNRRRHRYETAYIEKRVLGHYPVQANIDGKTGTFSLVTEDDDGKWIERRFILDGYQVHRLGESVYQRPSAAAGNLASAAAPSIAASQSWSTRIKQKFSKMLGP